jgi:hypothetical protein
VHSRASLREQGDFVPVRVVCEIAHAKLFHAIQPADDLGEALGNEGGLEQPKVFRWAGQESNLRPWD